MFSTPYLVKITNKNLNPSVLCDTNRYRRNIGIEIENFRYFRYRIGIGIERGVIRGIGIGIGIVRRVSEVLVLVSVL